MSKDRLKNIRTVIELLSDDVEVETKVGIIMIYVPKGEALKVLTTLEFRKEIRKATENL